MIISYFSCLKMSSLWDKTCSIKTIKNWKQKNKIWKTRIYIYILFPPNFEFITFMNVVLSKTELHVIYEEWNT